MRILDGFVLRSVLGESVIVAEGAAVVNFNKLISLNESAALLWKAVEGKDFTIEDLVQILLDNYEVEYEDALKGAKNVCDKWIKAGIVV